MNLVQLAQAFQGSVLKAEVTALKRATAFEAKQRKHALAKAEHCEGVQF